MNQLKMMSATLGILSAILAPSLRASETDKMTYITTNQPLQIQGKLLAPGRYVLKLVNPDFDHRTVAIYDEDGSRFEGIVTGLPAYRLDLSTSQLTISNPQAGEPAMLRFWFYPGDNVGLEFVTPKGAALNAQKREHKGKPQHVSQPADDADSTHD